ncbi:MAG: hypothetical protein KDJ87_18315 [Rhizobiaceae bacterium]|nr:hypothetical protein [Rhizobiaceae bacterium]
MFVGKKLVYLQMQKTGSTHVTKVLKQNIKGKTRERHEQLEDYAAFADRPIISSVRNPWDWYVSLWAFGCSGGGGFHKYLIHNPWSEIRHAIRYRKAGAVVGSLVRLVTRIGRRPDWKALYSDARNEANFRIWLKLVLGAEGLHIAKEGYAASPVRNVIGFMTFRFLALTTAYDKWNGLGRKAGTYEELAAFADAHTVTSRILRMESLNEELLDLLTSVGKTISMEDLEAIGKTNASSHRKYDTYYDDETYRLVAERDRFIIERYGYTMF